jgi:hypothetical protein
LAAWSLGGPASRDWARGLSLPQVPDQGVRLCAREAILLLVPPIMQLKFERVEWLGKLVRLAFSRGCVEKP